MSETESLAHWLLGMSLETDGPDSETLRVAASHMRNQAQINQLLSDELVRAKHEIETLKDELHERKEAYHRIHKALNKKIAKWRKQANEVANQ